MVAFMPICPFIAPVGIKTAKKAKAKSWAADNSIK